MFLHWHAAARAVPVLGQFRVDLADITLEGLDLADASTGLALGGDGAFLLSVQGLRASVTTRFTYQRTSFPQARSGRPAAFQGLCWTTAMCDRRTSCASSKAVRIGRW